MMYEQYYSPEATKGAIEDNLAIPSLEDELPSEEEIEDALAILEAQSLRDGWGIGFADKAYQRDMSRSARQILRRAGVEIELRSY